jgi:putative DNA primase/helicase
LAGLRIDAVYLSDALGKVARWERKSSNEKWLSTDVPDKVAVRILSRKGEWRFPKVAGIISTPTLRPDGTILSAEGYDPATRYLLLAPPPMPAIPERPTLEDARAALTLLKELLVEFPLVTDVDRAVALSGLITPVARGAFVVVPMHAARAPVPSSGKSYLWDCASAIATGQIMPVISKGPNEEEL